MADNPRNTPHEGPRNEGTRSRAQVGPGMRVEGMDGKNVGRVKAVEETRFALDRPKAPDLFVPLEAVMEIRNGSLVVLRVLSTLIHRQGWPTSKGDYW